MKSTVLAERCLSHLLNVTDNNILIELCESSQMFVEKIINDCTTYIVIISQDRIYEVTKKSASRMVRNKSDQINFT